jgi:hypothetical protein
MTTATIAPRLIDTLPDPPQIRARLCELATEANFLRRLLRLLERNRASRPARRQATAGKEVCHAKG